MGVSALDSAVSHNWRVLTCRGPEAETLMSQRGLRLGTPRCRMTGASLMCRGPEAETPPRLA